MEFLIFLKKLLMSPKQLDTESLLISFAFSLELIIYNSAGVVFFESH